MSLRQVVASAAEGHVPSTDSPAGTTTSVLFLRARRGDIDALAALLREHLPRLRRWARGRLPGWVRSAADTSDLVQDALAGTLARLDLFQPRSHRALAAYLRAAVRNRIADEHRRAGRWVCREITDAFTSPERSPLDRAIDAETRRRYLAALDALSRRDRELIVAHLELDYTHAQLACMIGRSPNAARMALTRALARLAERMAGR
jgi:RNA polymerase sigma-70 factor (ECF subfamily)